MLTVAWVYIDVVTKSHAYGGNLMSKLAAGTETAIIYRYVNAISRQDGMLAICQSLANPVTGSSHAKSCIVNPHYSSAQL